MIKTIQRLIDRILGRRRHPDLDWPRDLKDQCDQAYGQAKHVSRNVYGKIDTYFDCDMVLYPSNRRIGGILVYQDPRLPGYWVAGSFEKAGKWKGRISLPSQSANKITVIDYSTLLHEMFHLILWAVGIKGHDPRFDEHAPGWRDSRNISGVSTSATPTNAKSMDVTYVDEDHQVHAIHFDRVYPEVTA